MATLAPQERLQPALLDRLVDDEPQKNMEAREARLITVRRLRTAVLRDLAWLFNSTQPSPGEIDPELYPEAARSVLAYGLPPLAGNTMSAIDVGTLESRIRDAILQFEPRMVASTLKVTAVAAKMSADHHNQLQVEIRGNLWAQPIPIEMLLRTEVDLESGEVRINDLTA